MTKEQAIRILKADETDDSFDWNELGLKGTEDFNRAWDKAYNMAIEALELVNNFEMAHIITDGRLNGRTSAYKCGLMDGQRLAGEKIVLEFKTESERDCKTCKHSINGYCAGTEECHECMWDSMYEQRTCDSAISREKAIKEFQVYREYSSNLTNNEWVDRIEKVLECLPPVTPESIKLWIPLSEMPPKDGTWNIFTDGKNKSVERYKMDAIDHFWPEGRWFNFEDAVAWLPLPEDYKPESEVQK